jgi:diadenosine tetraphosphate (Ap4A) HIT family hydrolase
MNEYFFITPYWKIILCDDQRYFGYLIIKTVTQRESLPDITEEEQFDFFRLIKKLEAFYKEKFCATMFNYSCLMNNAYRDHEKPWVHFHMRPRYSVPVSLFGNEYADPNFGEHYLSASLSGNGKVSIPEEVKAYIISELKEYCK